MTEVDHAGRAERLLERSEPFLCRVAGARPDLLFGRVSNDRNRYVALGALLLGTASIATVSMWLALGQVFDAGWFLATIFVAPALAWGGFILLVDRALITGVTTSSWRRTSTLCARLVIAAVLGVVVAEPLILTVFSSAIEARIETSNAAEEDRLRSGLLRCNPVPGESAPPADLDCGGFGMTVGTAATAQAGTLVALQADATRLEQSLKVDTDRQNELDRRAADECGGVPGPGLSGQVGYGRLCLDARQYAQVYREYHPDQPRRGQLDALTAQITAAQGPAGAARSAFEETRNAQIDRRVQELRGDRPTIGLLERLDALDQLTSAHAGLSFREWFLRLFLIAIDCLPVLVKFIGGVTRYDRASDEAGSNELTVFSARQERDRTVALTRIQASKERRTEKIEARTQRRRADRAAREAAEIEERTERLRRQFRPSEPRRDGDQVRPQDEEEHTMYTDALGGVDPARVLASAAAGALVRAMGAKTWSALRDRWASCFRRHEPGTRVAEELDGDAEAARAGADGEVRAKWRDRMEGLLRDHPELRREIEELATWASPSGSTAQRTSVNNGFSVQSGRDTSIGGDVG